ncbi:MAG: hypothetical protein ABI395_11120 [Sphingobium sp.]
MKSLSPQELRDLRSDMSGLGIDDAQLDDLIRLIDNVVISIIDQSHGKHPVQLSLAARANYAFQGESNCDNLPKMSNKEQVTLRSRTPKAIKIPKGDYQP